MPATIQDLKKVRQELNTKTPLLFQAEVFENWIWFKDTKFKEPYNRTDFKITLIKEALNIWDNKTYNIENINKMFDDGKSHNWETVLNSWLDLRKTGKLQPDYFMDYYLKDMNGDKRAIPEIYEDWNDEIKELEQQKTTAEAEVKKYKESLGTETPEQLKEKLTALNEAKTKAEQDKATAEEATRKAKEAQATAEQDLKDLQKAAGEKAGKDNTKITELEKELEKNKGEAQLYQAGFFKLVEVYTAEITKATQLFYQDLSLDNNWINEKYGNKEVNYINLLTRKLNDKSDTEDIINAFKIIALIVATEKAQIKSDEHKDISKLKPAIKKVNLRAFNKIKDTWETLADETEPKEENNPLYLPIIKNKNDYIAQIDKIISIWQ